jgi:hypothetical protein
MSERALKQLVGALAVVVALWFVASLFSRGGGSIDAPGGLDATLDGVDEASVTAVRFVQPGETIELVRGEDAWRVNGFRADSGSVARFFQSVDEAEVDDLVATNPTNHERMGVAGDSVRTLEIDVAGETRSLLVGNTGPRFSSAYARLPGEDEVYLLEGGLRTHLTRDLTGWRNRKMVAIDTSRVSRIEVERDGEDFTLVRGDSAWTFEDGGPVVERPVQSILQELAGALVAAGFVAEGDSIGALPQGGSTVVYSEAGDVLAEVMIGSGSGERWAMAAGDSVRYRIASFRANLIVPTLESVTPDD